MRTLDKIKPPEGQARAVRDTHSKSIASIPQQRGHVNPPPIIWPGKTWCPLGVATFCIGTRCEAFRMHGLDERGICMPLDAEKGIA